MDNVKETTYSQFVDQIMDQYRQYDEKTGRIKKDEIQEVENLTIRSVVPLTEAEKRQIIALFLKKIDRPLGEVNEIIDPDLVTGVSIQSESYYFEVSGRQQLSHMHDMFHAKS